MPGLILTLTFAPTLSDLDSDPDVLRTICARQERVLALEGQVIELQWQLQQLQLERVHNQAQLAALSSYTGPSRRARASSHLSWASRMFTCDDRAEL
jgi:hypothetical protein